MRSSSHGEGGTLRGGGCVGAGEGGDPLGERPFAAGRHAFETVDVVTHGAEPFSPPFDEHHAQRAGGLTEPGSGRPG